MKQTSLLKSMLLLCSLIVGSSAWATTYKLTNVTSVSAGNKYVFVRNSRALSNTVSYSKLQTTDSYSTTGLSGSEAYVWTLETATGGFYVKNAALKSNQYLNNTSSGNISFGNTNSVWSIAFTDGVALISNTSNSNRFIGETSSGSTEYKAYAASNLASYGHDISVYILEEEAAAAVSTPTFSVEAGTYTSTQSVELSCATGGATIYYTLDGSTPTDGSTQYTSAISVSETKTIKAIAKKGSDYSNVATATYTIYPVLHAGTELDPYTVADARNAIEANTGVSSVYATGIVSEIVTAYSSVNKNISFNISADGLTTSAQLQAYRCKKGDGGSDPDVADIQVGDVVIVKGNLTKYSSTYEFAQDNVLISLEHPTTPLITVTPTSLTGFTYGLGSGPSNVKTFSVEGSNLTENITLSLGVSSNYEMSLTENNGYTNELSLTPTTGTVAATDIYVRLKAGLAVNASYEGTVTLTSTGAIDKAVSLAGSVTQPNFTWDLSTDKTETATESEMTWTGTQATMRVDKGSATTATNNYYPGTGSPAYTSTRFYKNSILTITPVSGYSISSVVFTATTEGYATTLKNSTWTNASAAASSTTVTVTPTDGESAISATIGGTCGFTAVKVYYEQISVPVSISDAGLATFASDVALDFSGATGVEAYIAKESAGAITLTKVTKVPANTGVLLRSTSGSAVAKDVPVAATTDDVTGNLFVRGNDAAVATGSGPYNYVLGKKSGVVGFYKANGAVVNTDKAYLQTTIAATRIDFNFDNEEATAIETVKAQNAENGEFFDLQGRKVANPTKGLYIVNGKKVIIK